MGIPLVIFETDKVNDTILSDMRKRIADSLLQRFKDDARMFAPGSEIQEAVLVDYIEQLLSFCDNIQTTVESGSAAVPGLMIPAARLAHHPPRRQADVRSETQLLQWIEAIHHGFRPIESNLTVKDIQTKAKTIVDSDLRIMWKLEKEYRSRAQAILGRRNFRNLAAATPDLLTAEKNQTDMSAEEKDDRIVIVADVLAVVHRTRIEWAELKFGVGQ